MHELKDQEIYHQALSKRARGHRIRQAGLALTASCSVLGIGLAATAGAEYVVSNSHLAAELLLKDVVEGPLVAAGGFAVVSVGNLTQLRAEQQLHEVSDSSELVGTTALES